MTVNPFDLHNVLTAKHAQHVVLIHFPIALFTAAVAFDYLAFWTKSRSLASAAYFNLLAAALVSIPTVVTGVLAWKWALEGQRLKGILLEHLVLGLASAILIWIVSWMHWRARQRADTTALPILRFVIEFVGLALITVTGHLGGFLSGVNLPS